MKKIIIVTTFVFLIILGINSLVIAEELIGAGATFPFPLYSKMFDAYNSKYGVKINYQAIGSGGGIKQLFAKTVDFGASDAFLSSGEMSKAGAKVLHIPICLGAVVLTYNLPGNPKLKLTPDVIADIFLGNIKEWNNSRITSLNPGVKLSGNIIVVHRSDGSGTSFIFTDYLTKVSKSWATKVGTGKAVNWPTGLGGKGNPGVAGLVKQNQGSIGYTELIYALENGLSFASVKNKAGKFIEPTISSTSQAASTSIPPDTRASITNSSLPSAYPISGFTWILVYKDQNYGGRTVAKAKSVAKLLWWMIHEGQSYASPLKYAPLSKMVLLKAESIVKSITFAGKPVI